MYSNLDLGTFFKALLTQSSSTVLTAHTTLLPIFKSIQEPDNKNPESKRETLLAFSIPFGHL